MTSDLMLRRKWALRAHGRFDLITFPANSAERFVDDSGTIRISHHDLLWIRLT